MNILVTAGNTLVPIDKVRCISNILTGRTGAAIAIHAHQRGHTVTLLTSHPEVVAGMSGLPTDESARSRWNLLSYKTFDDLENMMARLIAWEPEALARDERACASGYRAFDAVIHCAAVSDYRSAGIYAPGAGTRFDSERQDWRSSDGLPTLEDRTAGKVKSDEAELWLRLVKTPKLVDRIRTDWKFTGLLVKFKLEVGVTDKELLAVAERSRVQSTADFMVANTLEGTGSWAYVGPTADRYQRISRRDLPARLLTALENKYKERHG
jgi:phosphopantothenoylcysteine synthetase/decarboxylase